MSVKLAINGGDKIRTELFPDQNTIDKEEIHVVNQVLRRGMLTGYQGNAGAAFYGGPEIQALEKEWSETFGAKDRKLNRKLYSLPTNSCTSALFAACGAIGIKPGDEVIVTPYSMTCSATAPMIWGGVPVFADVDSKTFNLDPDDVERKITSKTKAIIVVDLFGLPYDSRIDEIAKKHNLIVIEDAAQAIGAKRGLDYAGTLGHIGVYSFNQGKHLTCGEGGMICTYDKVLMQKCRLLVNHAEAVINSMLQSDKYVKLDFQNYSSMFGFNLRMTEINAAIVRVQLFKLQRLLVSRVINAVRLSLLLSEIPGLHLPHFIERYNTHTLYVLPVLFNEDVWGIHRDIVINAVKAELMPCAGREEEGVTINGGYITPIWRMPVFNKLYPSGISCTPNCDELWRDKLIVIHRLFGPKAQKKDMENVAAAFEKVWNNKEELK